MAALNIFSISYSPPLIQTDGPLLTLSLVLLAIILSYGASAVIESDPYANIPAIGGSDFFSAYLTSKRLYNHSLDLIVAGYDKYKGRAFRIPDGGRRWNVIVTRPDQIEEMRKAPDDVLSLTEFINEFLFIKYLMGPTVATNNYHVGVVRSQLTKNLLNLFDNLWEEIQVAFNDNIPRTDDWSSVHAYPKIAQIAARAFNRIVVGLPLCREEEYLRVNIDFTMDVDKGRKTLVRTPTFLRPLVARYLKTVPRSVAIASKYLRPIIEERRKKIEEYGPDFPDKPADVLSWLMEEATGDELSVTSLTNRVLALNFAAISTSSMIFTHALYHLAAEPHYIQPIREEVEAVIAEEGWSKVAMTKMHKLDSFLKESLRYNGNTYLSLSRLALKDFILSDGTSIPKGAFVSAAAYPIHHDDDNYTGGDKFDGFRFAKIRAQDGLNTTNQFVNTSPGYIPFGHGKHACPGRFFAANKLKVMMAHLVLNYDVKMEKEGVRPPNTSAAMACAPDLTAEVMFKRHRR